MNIKKYVIREYRPEDKNFIFSTWLKGLYHGCDLYHEIPNMIFFANYQKALEKIIEHSTVEVACLREEEDVVLGYSVFTNDTLHWVFVKDSWRKMGIGKALVPPKIKYCSHLTKLGKYLKKKYEIEFNPFNL